LSSIKPPANRFGRDAPQRPILKTDKRGVKSWIRRREPRTLRVESDAEDDVEGEIVPLNELEKSDWLEKLLHKKDNSTLAKTYEKSPVKPTLSGKDCPKAPKNQQRLCEKSDYFC
jgi:hypothetical protein